MIKALLALAVVVGLGWAVYDQLELGDANRGGNPGGPSVPYPVVEQQTSDGVADVGSNTGGLLGN